MRWPKDPDISHKYPGRDIYTSSLVYSFLCGHQWDFILVIKSEDRNSSNYFSFPRQVHFFLRQVRFFFFLFRSESSAQTRWYRMKKMARPSFKFQRNWIHSIPSSSPRLEFRSMVCKDPPFPEPNHFRDTYRSKRHSGRDFTSRHCQQNPGNSNRGWNPSRCRFSNFLLRCIRLAAPPWRTVVLQAICYELIVFFSFLFFLLCYSLFYYAVVSNIEIN